MDLKIKFQLDPGAFMPFKAHDDDAGYTGTVGIYVRYIPSDFYRSLYGKHLKLKRGERIAQIVFNRVPYISLELGDVVNLQTERGANGFGSSGV